MSVANVKAFFEELQRNGELREKLKSANVRDKQAAALHLIRTAAEAGYSFTAEEYDESTRGHAGPPPAKTKPSA